MIGEIIAPGAPQFGDGESQRYDKMGNRKVQPEKSLGREQQEGTIEFHERNRKAETQEGRYGETPKNKTNSGNQRGIPARGKMLESYQIIKTIGAGSMGKVKQAVDTRTGRKVAIKIIPRLDPKVSVNLPKYHIDNSGLATTKLGNASGISVDSGKVMAIKKLTSGNDNRASVYNRGEITTQVKSIEARERRILDILEQTIVYGGDDRKKKKKRIFKQPRERMTTKEREKTENKDMRVLREVAILQLLDHPNISRLYEVIVHPNHFYLVTELITGGQIFEYIVSKGRLSEAKTRKFARQIASALDYCHRNNIVHRDLKIENIMITEEGDVKIIDFGLSNVYSPRTTLSTHCGSLYFAAPELLRAQTYIGPEVDIWSFGVVVYVLVCGRVPFDDPSMSVLHKKIKAGRFDIPTFVTEGCRHLLSRTLTVNPKQRATMAEVLVHPWMVEGHNKPIEQHIPPRVPIIDSSDIDDRVIQRMEAYLGFGFGHRECIKECIQATIESQWYHDSIRKYLRAHIKQLSRNLDDNNNNNNNSRKHDTEVDADTEAETETAVALVLDPVKKANRPDQSAADTVVSELGSNLGGDFNMKRFSSPPEYLSMKKTAINNNINNLQNSKTFQSNTIQSPHMDSNLGRMANPAPRERTEISDYARVLKKLAKTQINAYKNRSTIGNVRDIIGTTPRPVPIPGFKPLMTSIHATTTSGTSTDERYVPSDMNPNLYYYISNAYNELLATDPLLSIYYLIQDKLELSSASVSYQNQNQNQGINTSNYSSIWNASTNPIGSSRLNTSTIAHKSMVPSTNTSTPPTNTCFTGPSFQNSSSSRLNNRKSIPIKLNSAFTDHANSDALLMKNPIPKPPNQKNSIINDNSSQLPKTNTKTNTNTNTNTNFDVPKSTNEPQALDRSLTKRGSWFTSLFSNNKHNTLTDSQLKSKPQLKPESHSEKPKKIGKIKSLSRFLFSTSSNHGSSLQPDQKKSTRITSTLGATSPSSVDIRANTNDTKSSSLHLPINNDDNSNNDNNSNNSNNFNSTNTNYQRFDDFYKQIALKKLVSKSITSSLKKKAVIRDELIRGLDTLNISYTEGSGYFYCFLSEPRKESTTLPRLPSPSRHSASLSISFSSSDKVEVQAERRPEKKADLRAEQNLVLLPSSSTEAINFNVHTLAFYIYLVKFPSYVLPSAHGIEFMLHSGDFMRYKDVVSKLLDTIRI